MSTSSASDVRSPKRQAISSVVALDAAIWTSIIEFLPVRAESAEGAAKEASATLQTLLNLRLVSEELAQLLHPTKSKVLWQRLLVRTFDFSTSDDYWNVTNENDLFHDLIQLLRLPDGEEMKADGEGCEPVHKCLAAPAANSDPSAPFYSHYVMQTLGYAPHFWNSGEGIGDAWKGFTEPNAFATDFEHAADEEHFDENTAYSFPWCSLGNAKKVFRSISQFHTDWRSECCNSGSDGETPVFYVGKSKAQPYRWTGYGGVKVWT